MLPEPSQLDLFGQKPSKDEPVLLQPVSPEENQTIEVHSRSPTEEEIQRRISQKSKERGDRLREMSRALSSKSNQPGINQD